MNKTELETKANAIDAVLAQHRIEGRISGGVVMPRTVQFTLATIATANKVKLLAGELAKALGVPEVRIERQGSHLVVEVRRDDALRPTVELLPLMARLAHGHHALGEPEWNMPLFTAALGMCDDGAPLLVRLPSESVGHVLITGAEGCGKSSLLRTIAVSLAACHRPREFRLVLLLGPELADLAGLPHVANCTLGDLTRLSGRDDDALGTTDALRTTSPRVVVLIDDLLTDISDDFARLLSDGHAAGIHVVASGSVSSAGFGTLIKGNGEPGDFEVHTAAGETVRFQAAYIAPAEIEQVVASLSGQHQTAAVLAG